MNKISTYTLSLFLAYTSNEITEQEFYTLEKWLNKNSENKQLFSEYLHFYKKSRRIGFIENLDKDKAWNNILLQLEKPLKHIPISKKETFKVRYIKLASNILKYAAIAIIFLGIGYLYQNDYFNNNPVAIIPSDKITLELENGNIIVISENGTTKVEDSKGNIVGTLNGNRLVYNNEVEKETLAYNTLTIPYGKRFQLILSDGTLVHLNAGTSLKFPINFIKGKNRHVLLDGEAYFDVTEDKKHPFIVNANDLNVMVLGTEFNVSYFPEDNTINTVLIEGSVSLFDNEVYNEKTASVLKPGFKASWDKTNGAISINEVDTDIYTGWMEGRLIFKNIQFKNIIKKLERRYNVSIINNNIKLGEQYYDATFDIEAIEQVLNSFNKSYAFQYTIENNKIIIN